MEKTQAGRPGQSPAGWYPRLSRTRAFQNRLQAIITEEERCCAKGPSLGKAETSSPELGIHSGKVIMERVRCCSGQPGGKERIVIVGDRWEGKASGEVGETER